MSRKYATKSEIFADMLKQARKTERRALELIERNSPAANDSWAKANELFAKANAYSIRWNLI